MKKTLAIITATLALFSFNAQAQQQNMTEQQKQQMRQKMKEVDTNKDKQVSRDEYLSAANKRFDNKDLNHDGYITKDEAQKNHQGRQQHRQERRDGRQQ